MQALLKKYITSNFYSHIHAMSNYPRIRNKYRLTCQCQKKSVRAMGAMQCTIPMLNVMVMEDTDTEITCMASIIN